MRGDDQKIPERLPLLDEYLKEHAAGKTPLTGVTAVLIQHQMGSQVRMAEGLIRLGLDPNRIYWVDIPYTANAAVRRALEGLGIPSENFSRPSYHLGKPYAAYQRRRVQELFSKLRKSLGPKDRLLILDDGSYYLDAISCYAHSFPRVSIVEQTTRGIIKIQRDPALRYYCSRAPIINVAQSAPKKNLESPFIGEAVCEALGKRLRTVRFGKKDRCLILGFGAIGECVAQSLEERLGVAPSRIYVMDPHRNVQKKALRRGHRLWNRDSLGRLRFRLVVGCSGTTSFTIGDRVFLEDGAVLASASSGSSELSREEFIDLADTVGDDDIYLKGKGSLRNRPIHSDIELHLVDRDVRFLNGGFPVNFDGRVNCVPPQFIQATHTLQVGAAVQAVQALNTKARGLIDLDQRLCDWVNGRFRHILKEHTNGGGRHP